MTQGPTHLSPSPNRVIWCLAPWPPPTPQPNSTHKGRTWALLCLTVGLWTSAPLPNVSYRILSSYRYLLHYTFFFLTDPLLLDLEAVTVCQHYKHRKHLWPDNLAYLSYNCCRTNPWRCHCWGNILHTHCVCPPKSSGLFKFWPAGNTRAPCAAVPWNAVMERSRHTIKCMDPGINT